MGGSGMSAEELKALRTMKKKAKLAAKKREREEAEAAAMPGMDHKERKAAKKKKKEEQAAAAVEESDDEEEEREEDADDATPEKEAPKGERIQVQVDGILSDKTFDSLTLSKQTMAGISELGYTRMTEVQARTIPPLLSLIHI